MLLLDEQGWGDSARWESPVEGGPPGETLWEEEALLGAPQGAIGGGEEGQKSEEEQAGGRQRGGEMQGWVGMENGGTGNGGGVGEDGDRLLHD